MPSDLHFKKKEHSGGKEVKDREMGGRGRLLSRSWDQKEVLEWAAR